MTRKLEIKELTPDQWLMLQVSLTARRDELQKNLDSFSEDRRFWQVRIDELNQLKEMFSDFEVAVARPLR